MVIQCLLVIIALLCVPCMLIVKTLVLRRQYLRRKHLVRLKYHLNIYEFCTFMHTHSNVWPLVSSVLRALRTLGGSGWAMVLQTMKPRSSNMTSSPRT